MKIGDRVLFEGRRYLLRGLDPMSVTARRAELEDPSTGRRRLVPLREIRVPDRVGFEDEAPR